MNVNQDLLGKTITGVIATNAVDSGLREIWMMQFADGSHVEFVSPGARKALRQAAAQRRAAGIAKNASQFDAKARSGAANTAAKRQNGRSVQRADNHSPGYRREADAVVQLTLNVA